MLAVASPNMKVGELYHWWIGELDELLADRDEEAIIVVDGLDDSSYRPAHRALDLRARRIIEDPLMQSSRHSQLIQMADLIAHAAFQHLAGDAKKRFMWDWYPQLLPNSVFAGEWGAPQSGGPRKAKAPRWRGLVHQVDRRPVWTDGAARMNRISVPRF